MPKITPANLKKLKSLVKTSTAKEDLENASHDETEDLKFYPEAVVFPKSTKEVSEILKFASKNKIPVTPRGGGTGLSGGALPVKKGIVINLTKMDKILEIDKENFFVISEAGIITESLQNTVEKENLFYPVDPASRGTCTIGGNLAHGAGGPRALKYGVTKDFVYGLKAVLPNGEVITTGGKVLKNATGYNLAQLLIGSEGTLAIITEVTLKLLPLPKYKQLLAIPYKSIDDAARTVPAIFMEGIVPSVVEILESSVIKVAMTHVNKDYPHHDAPAQLLIEVDGNNEGLISKECERICEVALSCGAIDVLVADTSAKQEELWAVRKAAGEAVKKISPYRELDTVVPRTKLPLLVSGVKNICRKYNVISYCYGHAGDGNMHMNILKEGKTDKEWKKIIPKVTKDVFKFTVSLGGKISGEHGIGYIQKDYINIPLSKEEIKIMKQLKKVFDPRGILNPGKIIG